VIAAPLCFCPKEHAQQKCAQCITLALSRQLHPLPTLEQGSAGRWLHHHPAFARLGTRAFNTKVPGPGH
jgi:hypothetical protein